MGFGGGGLGKAALRIAPLAFPTTNFGGRPTFRGAYLISGASLMASAFAGPFPALTLAFPQGLAGLRKGTPRSRQPVFRVCGGPPISMMPRARRQHLRQVMVG